MTSKISDQLLRDDDMLLAILNSDLNSLAEKYRNLEIVIYNKNTDYENKASKVNSLYKEQLDIKSEKSNAEGLEKENLIKLIADKAKEIVPMKSEAEALASEIKTDMIKLKKMEIDLKSGQERVFHPDQFFKNKLEAFAKENDAVKPLIENFLKEFLTNADPAQARNPKEDGIILRKTLEFAEGIVKPEPEAKEKAMQSYIDFAKEVGTGWDKAKINMLNFAKGAATIFGLTDLAAKAEANLIQKTMNTVSKIYGPPNNSAHSNSVMKSNADNPAPLPAPSAPGMKAR